MTDHPTDRSIRTFFAVLLLVTAALLLTNLIVQPDTLGAWGLPVALVTLGGSMLLWAWLWAENRPRPERSQPVDTSTGNLQLPQQVVREWQIAPPVVPAPVAPQGPIPALVEPDLIGDPLPFVSDTPGGVPLSEEHGEIPDDPAPPAAMTAVPPVIDVLEPEIKPAVMEASDEPILPPDDLTVIEGIGPKYNEMLHNAGVRTFVQLGAAPRERLVEIFQAAGYTRIPGSVDTWAEQAAYVIRGDMDGLRAYQATLNAGHQTDSADE